MPEFGGRCDCWINGHDKETSIKRAEAYAYVAADMRDDGGSKVLAAPLFFPVDFTKVGVMMAGQASSPINPGKGDTLLVDPRQFAGHLRLRCCAGACARACDCDCVFGIATGEDRVSPPCSCAAQCDT